MIQVTKLFNDDQATAFHAFGRSRHTHPASHMSPHLHSGKGEAPVHKSFLVYVQVPFCPDCAVVIVFEVFSLLLSLTDALGRVLSGSIRPGDSVRVLGEGYSLDDEEDMAIKEV